MSDKFQNKYRIASHRFKNHNYANDGIYFVTICTYNKECVFGQIVDGKMQLSTAGEIVKKEWLNTAMIRKNVIHR